MSLLPPKVVFPSINDGNYQLVLTNIRTRLQDVASWADAARGAQQSITRRAAALSQVQALTNSLGSTGRHDPFVYNWNPATQFSKFSVGKSSLASRRCIIAFDGDSTTVGYGAGTEGGTLPMTNCRLFSTAARLAYWLPKLSQGALPASFDSAFGFGNATAAIDSRVTLVGTADMYTSSGFGGPAIRLDASGEGIDFVPTQAFNAVDIYCLGQNASVTVAVDGGATIATRFFTNNSQVNRTTTTGITLGTHTLNIRWNAGPAYICGIVCYNTTAPVIEVYNGGSGGSKVSDWNDNIPGFGLSNGALATTPDLVMINLGINDSGNNVTDAAYYSGLDTMISRHKNAGSDVILFMPTPVNGSNSATNFPLYLAKLKLLSEKWNVPLVSWLDWFKTYSNLTTNWGMTDNTHPPAAVYDAEARWLAEQLINI